MSVFTYQAINSHHPFCTRFLYTAKITHNGWTYVVCHDMSQNDISRANIQLYETYTACNHHFEVGDNVKEREEEKEK